MSNNTNSVFGFETGDFTDWTTTGNTNIETESFNVSPTEGNYQALITNGSGSITDSQIETQLGLTPGTLDGLGNGNATEGSILESLTFTVAAGDSLSFDWNYLTKEGKNSAYNDFAFAALNGEVFTLANTKNVLVNSNTSFTYETGFNTFEYTFAEGGTYTLALGISDVKDTNYDSGLLIDNVIINLGDNPDPDPDPDLDPDPDPDPDPVSTVFGFETGDFTNWTTTGKTSIQTQSFGVSPTEGNYQALITNASGSITDSQIETQLGLTQGTLDGLGNGNATEGSILESLTFTVAAGDSLSFDWNYLTKEGKNSAYNDFAFAALNGEVFTLANTKNVLVNSNTSFTYETGFNTFEYTFLEGGTYTLALGISDVKDTNYDSGLLIDNVIINLGDNPDPDPDPDPVSTVFGFETADFTNWTTTGNTSIKTDSFGVSPTEGQYQAFITNGSGSISDSQIETQLGLTQGTLDGLGNGNATQGSLLESLTFTVEAGDSLSFDWNYLSGEGTNSSYNDFAFAALSNGEVFTLANTQSELVSSNTTFGYETGFNTFEYTFAQGGTYTLALGISDVQDTAVDSGLLIDNVIIDGDISQPDPDPNPDPDPDPNSDTDFDIDILFSGNWTASQEAIFSQAVEYWESVILGDISDVNTTKYGLVDDLVIEASSINIDGKGGILGQAGYTMLRSDGSLPVAGIMQFDSADLNALENNGQLLDVILHEMGHVIGAGTLWEPKGLVIDDITGPQYIGEKAVEAYNDIFGVNESSIALENTGGPGTYGSHWNEDVFGNELMTGYLNSGDNPMSYMTVASLEDIGYEVVAKEDFTDLYTPPALGGITASIQVSDPQQEYLDSLEMVDYKGPVEIV
jgi:hypothetical protein